MMSQDFTLPNTVLDKPFWVGEWRVDPATRRLSSGDVEVKLEPKVMQVLIRLAQNPGKVLSRESLEATVWAGTVVGYDALAASIIKLRKAFNDDSHHPRYIETVSKNGYRLIAPVTTDLELESSGQGSEPTTTEDLQPDAATPAQLRRGWRSNKLIVVAAGLLLIILVGLLLQTRIHTPSSHSSTQLTTRSKPATSSSQISVVVLPFENLSGESNQDYFSEGITDDIITDLLKVKGLRVIARQSAYFYKSKTYTLADVRRELGVKYVVQGSVQKSGERLRINIKLTDVAEGRHIWADRFDGKVSNVFAMEDDITKQVNHAMSVTLSSQESANLAKRPSTSFAAYDAFLLGQKLYRDRTKESYYETVDAYKRAIELDPNFARAYGALGVTYTDGYLYGWSDTTIKDTQDRALQLANKAYKLDPTSPQVNWSLGFVHIFRKEYAKAEEAAHRAITLSPNYADAYGLLAFIANWRNKPDDAIQYIKKAMSLNPYYTFDYPLNLGIANYELGHYTEAVTELKNALQRNETSFYSNLFLIVTYVRLGNIDDAEWQVQQLLVQWPQMTLTQVTTYYLSFEDKHLLKSMEDDLRKAGLPG